MGTNSAQPTMMANVPPKLMVSDLVGITSRMQPARMRLDPAPAANKIECWALSSSPERESAWRGGTEAASQAGGAAVSRVAKIPNKLPLNRLNKGICTLLTVITKNRSLMVRATRCMALCPINVPRIMPRKAPIRPTINASLSTRAKISRRVTPRQRSVPKSGRRCTTEKVMVL